MCSFSPKDHSIKKIRYGVAPFHPAVLCLGAKVVVELGGRQRSSEILRVGDRLALE